LLQTYFRGNDFATIKKIQPKIFYKYFSFKPITGKMIFTIKNFRLKNFHENFWFKPIPEEMIMQP